jgi:NAD(P)-dependent dehydrogenase (short-subunit alcohol dehydrogenase family)
MKPRALVTGGSRGIGAAIAVALARAGHPIVLNYLSNDAAAQATRVGSRPRPRSSDSWPTRPNPSAWS